MPLYEYKCDNCGDVFELIQRFSDSPLTTHEKCGGPVHRLISASALHFKGSGWYITDYAKSGSSAGGSSEKSEKAEKADKNGDTKSGSDSKSGSESSADSKSSSDSKGDSSKPAPSSSSTSSS